MIEGFTMFAIILDDVICAAHYTRALDGTVENIHGHNWNIRVTVTSPELNAVGMVLDFTVAKKLLREILNKYDYQNLNNIPPFNTIIPTTEHMARHFTESFQKKILEATGDEKIKVEEFQVTESPNCTAVYRP